MTQDPSQNPIITQTSKFRPTATVVGNREIRPSTTQWVNLFSIPTNPVDAVACSLQWLFIAKGSLELALICPIAIQCVFVFCWGLIAIMINFTASKDPGTIKDCIFTAVSILLGFLLCLV